MSQSPVVYDIAIAGGGAAGLAAAVAIVDEIRASKSPKHCRIVVIDQNDFAGRKLATTGNGRGNLANTNVGNEMGQSNYIGTFAQAATKIVAAFRVDDLCAWFLAHGIATYDDSEGRVYPVSDRARQVSDLLFDYATHYGVEFIFAKQITHFGLASSIKRLKLNDGTEILANSLIMAMGSPAGKNIGGIDNLEVLATQKIGVEAFQPALTALEVNWNKAFLKASGVRFGGTAEIQNERGDKRRVSGEFLITPAGLSGIAAFQLTCFAGMRQAQKLTLKIDFLDAAMPLFGRISGRRETITKLLEANAFRGKSQLFSALCGVFPYALARALAAEINSTNPATIVEVLSGLTFAVTGMTDFAKAQVAHGGVVASEIDPATLLLRRYDNVYVVGELLDVIGDTGGYNLQFAFMSGISAARHAFKVMRQG